MRHCPGATTATPPVGDGSYGDHAIATHLKRGGKCAGIGRKKGVPNRVTAALKEAILLAAAECPHTRGRGLLGYLLYVATVHPKTFSRSLLARLIPYSMAMRAEVTAQVQTADEVRQKLRDRGIPVDKLDRLFELPSLPDPPPRHDAPAPPPPVPAADAPPAADPSQPMLPIPSYAPLDPQPHLRLVNGNADEEDADHAP
jgi:hypothetical protein